MLTSHTACVRDSLTLQKGLEGFGAPHPSGLLDASPRPSCLPMISSPVKSAPESRLYPIAFIQARQCPPIPAYSLGPLFLFPPKPFQLRTPKPGGFTHQPPINLPVNKDGAWHPRGVEHEFLHLYNWFLHLHNWIQTIQWLL